jgi:RimJ/RimL family protein N-acetyltransferase
MANVSVRLEPWSTTDGPLMERLLGDPAMTVHLGGPESPQKLADRQARYEKPDSHQYKIVVGEPGEGVGAVGYWEREESGDTIWEVGWLVVPEQQGKGYASAGMRMLLELMRADDIRHESLHAYPSVDNAASNAICRKLGFTLVGPTDFEYPHGSGQVMRCNDWRYELFPERP